MNLLISPVSQVRLAFFPFLFKISGLIPGKRIEYLFLLNLLAVMFILIARSFKISSNFACMSDYKQNAK